MSSIILNLNEMNRVIRLKEVKRLTGLSTSTIWRKEQTGEFPARIKLSCRAAGWLLADVNRWLQDRIAECG
jgi:prophage regulatory protein